MYELALMGTLVQAYSFLALPRARRVGQPLFSTLISSLYTLLIAICHIFLLPLLRNPRQTWVDVLLINGPGTCVVLVLVSWMRRVSSLSLFQLSSRSFLYSSSDDSTTGTGDEVYSDHLRGEFREGQVAQLVGEAGKTVRRYFRRSVAGCCGSWRGAGDHE